MNQTQANPNKSGSGSKVLAGCLIAVAVVVVLLAGAAWWFVGRPISQVAKSAQELTRIGALDEQVVNRSSFTPPAGGVLDEQQLQRYVGVLESIRGSMEARFRELEERYEQVGTERPGLMDIPRMAGAYADFIGLLGDARSAQVAAINEYGFSLEEYSWTRRSVLQAAGLNGADYDIGNFLTALGGEGDLDRAGAAVQVPEANRELVGQFREQLGELSVLAVLGL